MKVAWRRSAQDDVIRQFRYYLVTQDAPDVAVRFRASLRQTITSLLAHPLMASPHPVKNPRLQGLRSWPVAGFEKIRIDDVADSSVLRVIRVLHGKRNIRRILEAGPL